MSRIYLSVPHMGGEEQAFVAEAFRSNWLSSVGPNLDGFEREFADYIGMPSVALSSGTAALHLGLRLLGVGPGDEVLCPTFTFVATVNPVVYQGARPVLIDSETTSWNLDPNLLEDALRARRAKPPKAIMVVHIFGQSADLDAIEEVARRYGVPVIEDAAEALGATYKGRAVGSRGLVSAFSFNGNKIITTSGGGMLVTSDPAWAERVRFWSTQSRDTGIGYEHSQLGYNYRLSNVLAGIGRGQLKVLGARVAARRAVAARYAQAFADLEGVEPMPQAPWGVSTHWLSCFTFDERRAGCSRDQVMHALAAQDIESRPAWKPMHLQALYAQAERYGGAVAEDIGRRGLCLPSSSSLSESEQNRVIEVVRATVSSVRAGRPALTQESLHG